MREKWLNIMSLLPHNVHVAGDVDEKRGLHERAVRKLGVFLATGDELGALGHRLVNQLGDPGNLPEERRAVARTQVPPIFFQ